MEELRKSFDTNVIGMTLCCREGIQCMQRRGQKNGHIININRYLKNKKKTFCGAIIQTSEISVRNIRIALKRFFPFIMSALWRRYLNFQHSRSRSSTIPRA